MPGSNEKDMMIMKQGEKMHPVFAFVMMSLALLGACKKPAPDTVAPDGASGADASSSAAVAPVEPTPSSEVTQPQESAPAPVEAPPADAEAPAAPATGDGAAA